MHIKELNRKIKAICTDTTNMKLNPAENYTKSITHTGVNANSDTRRTKCDDCNYTMGRARIMKNLIVVCIGFLFLFSAYLALANLQSTLNIEDDLGIASQNAIYTGLIVSSLFLPKLIIKTFGCKLTMVFSILTYCPYIVANFYSHKSTLIPTAIILGLGAAPLWSAQCTYLNEISALYANQGTEPVDAIIARFFGIFFMFYQNSQIWGNLLSYYILKPHSIETTMSANLTTSILSTVYNTENKVTACGVEFCTGFTDSITPPPEDKKNILIAIFLALAVLSATIICMFLDPIKNKYLPDEETETALSTLTATIKHVKKPEQFLLLPLTTFIGMQQAFILGEYTQAYVGCAWGTHHVGLVFICYGVVDAITSYFSGRVIECISRMPVIFSAAIGNIAVCTFLFLWKPTAEESLYFLVIGGVWGFSDAIWESQISAFYGVLFQGEEEAAFSNYRLWESLGFCIAFSYNHLLCVGSKIYILLGFLTLGLSGYITVESRVFRRSKN